MTVQWEKGKWSLAMIKFKREEIGFISAGFVCVWGFLNFILLKETMLTVNSASLTTQAEIYSRQLFLLSPVFYQVQCWETCFLPEPSYSHPTAANPGVGCLGSSLLFRISESPG